MSVWPAKGGANGKTIIACKINVRGVLYACTVEMEKPAGQGFGAAAIALTPQFLFKPATLNGTPVESDVKIPINFSSPGGAPLPGQKFLSKPVWAEAPSREAMAQAYPAKARTERTSGLATLTCTFNKDGVPRWCETIREEPRGAGFGRAAQSLVNQFKGPTTLSDGKSTRGIGTQVVFSFAPQLFEGNLIASRPTWLETPNAAELLAVFPQAAHKAGITKARVILNCRVATGGRFEDCRTESEEPQGYEIAKAMLPLAGKFRISPWSEDGVPMVGGRLRVPIRYAIEDKDTPASPKP